MKKSSPPLLCLVLFIAAVSAAAAAGCVSAIPHPESRDLPVAKARWSDATLSELEQGRSAYVSKCSGCHQLFVPGVRGPESWPLALDEMSARAKLGPGQRVQIERYLVAISAR
jgi:cytochrome c5